MINTPDLLEKKRAKEYRKTWYYKVTLRSAECPENWVSGTKKSFLGFNFILWKIAKPTYQWADNS